MIALVLVLVAVPLQLLGYTGTCTQGSDDEALAGAVFSAPFLLAASMVMMRHARSDHARQVSYLLTGIIAVGMIAGTCVIWLSIFRFGNACVWKAEAGYDQSRDSGFGIRNAVMICSYVLLPLLVIVLACFDKALSGSSKFGKGA